MGRTHHYISEQGGKNILRYQYSAADHSLLYNHLISPFAQWIVNTLLPEWLAPNAITISGLALVASSHCLMFFYAPNMDEEAPRWVYFWSGLALLTYQVLDVADGKQARKTGNASPLGLLFDHGCDALNCVLSACTMATTMLMGASYMSIALVICPSVVFFMATFEEYYTGTLTLPIINGPNEGLAIMYMIYFITAWQGPDVWTSNLSLVNLPLNQVFVLTTIAITMVNAWMNFYNSIQVLSKQKKHIVEAFTGIFPCLMLLCIIVAWIVFSPTDIVKTHPRMLMWVSGLLFCKIVMHTMIAHLCEEPLQLLRKTSAFASAFILLLGGLAFVDTVSQTLESSALYLLFGLTSVVYMHMVYHVIMELTTILNIRCFVVKASKKKL